MNFKDLSEPFAADDIEWRIQSSGISASNVAWAIAFAYVTNRAIQSRLDEVCTPFGWKNEFEQAPDGGVMCGISIFGSVAGEGEWVRKWDGATNTSVKSGGVADESTNVKGGLSNAMKRAAVQWGIGRYLYKLDTSFLILLADKSGSNRLSIKDKSNNYHNFTWNPPQLPDWALPQVESAAFISIGDVATIKQQLKNKGICETKVLKKFNIEILDDLPASEYGTCLQLIANSGNNQPSDNQPE